MLGIGVIGTGHWGKNHVRTFNEFRSKGLIDHLKICDVDKQRVRELGENFGVEYTTDYKTLLDDKKIKAVSIATSSATHYQIAKEFLKAGKDVLVEKPMTINSKQGKDLVKIASDNKKILMVGHIFRYHPAINELKRRMEGGEFGKIYFFISNRLDIGTPRKDMGVIFALGIHEIDMFCHLLDVDYPNEITTVSGDYLQSDIEEMATIILGFDNGVKGYATESWLVPVYGKKRELVVIGSEQSARIDYLKPQEIEIFDVRIKTQRKKGDILFSLENTQTTIVPLEYREPLKEELRHFIECVKSRSKPLSDGIVGMRSIEIVEAALRSQKLKKTIKFK